MSHNSIEANDPKSVTEPSAKQPAASGHAEACGIDDLLDDALNDFDAPKRSLPEESTSLNQSQGGRQPQNEGQKFDPLRRAPQTNPKAKKFDPLQKKDRKAPLAAQSGDAQRSADFGAVPPDISDLDSELSKGLEQLMKELADVDVSQQSQAARPESQFADTLRALSESQAVLRDANGANAEAASASEGPLGDALLSGLQGRSGEGQEAFGSFADGIMRQLLSKEVLHQPMKDIAERYPGWLAAHRDSLPAAEQQRYEEQYRHIQAILHIYEHDPGNYAELFGALQQMQACGQPPQEIVNDLAPGMSFDEDGLPKLPPEAGAASGCCIQ